MSLKCFETFCPNVLTAALHGTKFLLYESETFLTQNGDYTSFAIKAGWLKLIFLWKYMKIFVNDIVKSINANKEIIRKGMKCQVEYVNKERYLQNVK